MPTAPGSAGTAPYARVTVLAPRHRVDVALPADVPVGELVPMVLELLGEPPPGRRPRPWRITGVSGGRLHPGATLDELGVLDGELLRIGPEDAPPPPPVFDDPVDALAATAGAPARGPGLHAGTAVTFVLAAAAAALLAAVGSPAPGAPAWAAGAAVAALLGAVGGLARAAVLVRRGSDRDAARPAALVSVPLAAAAGAIVGAPGGASLLLACAAAGIAAAAAQVVLRVVEPVLVATVVVAVPVAVVAAVHLRLGVGVGGLAAAVGGFALVAGPLLPRVALRLAGLPRPVVPADAGELRDADGGTGAPAPAELAARSALARGHLAGLVGGVAVLAGAGALPAAATGGWAGPALAVVIVAVLGLRARGFADPAPARTLLATCLATGIGLAAMAAFAGGPAVRAAVAAAVLIAAAVAVTVGGAAPAVSPVARRAVDLVEGVLVALSVPLALGAMGMYELVRGL
ncbi:type VII secretion integral membrane protein EccD [Pseudonocardia sp.]|uniref:type VII secretion integral membrane protein EccD n=1 Tax=Pseudonocardia sp. TaxID=60912 RepID=UPI002633A34E|nr:type VII secretion integral membrane protein EccD [Pseudonocardia sp.]